MGRGDSISRQVQPWLLLDQERTRLVDDACARLSLDTFDGHVERYRRARTCDRQCHRRVVQSKTEEEARGAIC